MSTQYNKKVLIIAYHFPPCAVSSGIQRTLSFVKNLPQHGWQPIVLTVNAAAHERTNPSQLKSIPPEAVVARAPALDAARHLSIGGRYWSRLTVPDRWRSWWLTAVPLGMKLIRQHNISAIWSTYPIVTAHSIGATLCRLSGLPWIADFRDPMVEHVARTNETFPKDPLLRNARLRVEAKAARDAACLVFCTNSAKRIVAQRYPAISDKRLAVITNGYDEQAFIEAEQTVSAPTATARRILLHSGVIYPGTDRDPTPLFKAIKLLAVRGLISKNNFQLRLRNPSAVPFLNKAAEDTGISDLVEIMPPIPYREALAEMLQVDGLLLLQGHTSNPAVPAKLYEYLRARRPILGLVDHEGETAATLRNAGITTRDITDVDGIAQLLEHWLQNGSDSRLQAADQERMRVYAREALTGQLAQLLDSVISKNQKRNG